MRMSRLCWLRPMASGGEGRGLSRQRGKTREQLADELAETKDEIRKTKAKPQKAMQYIRELEEAKEPVTATVEKDNEHADTVETLPNSMVQFLARGRRGMADDKPNNKRSLANEKASNCSSSYPSSSSSSSSSCNENDSKEFKEESSSSSSDDEN